jgi:hypothetical protein
MRSDDKRLHLKKHLRIVELATTKAELASAPAASDSFMGEVEDLPIQEREA